jgi:broad specificity phosphatase PhoE
MKQKRDDEKGNSRMLRLLLIRHGVTAYNLEARMQGQQDIPLSPSGERQAAAIAAALAQEPIDAIYTSDLRRAWQTADAIAAYHQCPVITWSELREVALGRFEGHTLQEVEQRYPRDLAAWQLDPIDTAPPGGETRRQLYQRTVRTYERLLVERPHGMALWVTHGGVIGMLLCHVLGMDIRRSWIFRRDNCAITELIITDSAVMLMRMNDTCHLRSLTGIEQEEAQVL